MSHIPDDMFDEFWKALCSAFDVDSLRNMLRTKAAPKLNKRFNQGTKEKENWVEKLDSSFSWDKPLDSIASDVLAHAKKNGWDLELLEASREFNPGNNKLQEIAKKYETTEQPTPPLPPNGNAGIMSKITTTIVAIAVVGIVVLAAIFVFDLIFGDQGDPGGLGATPDEINTITGDFGKFVVVREEYRDKNETGEDEKLFTVRSSLVNEDTKFEWKVAVKDPIKGIVTPISWNTLDERVLDSTKNNLKKEHTAKLDTWLVDFSPGDEIRITGRFEDIPPTKPIELKECKVETEPQNILNMDYYKFISTWANASDSEDFASNYSTKNPRVEWTLEITEIRGRILNLSLPGSKIPDLKRVAPMAFDEMGSLRKQFQVKANLLDESAYPDPPTIKPGDQITIKGELFEVRVGTITGIRVERCVITELNGIPQSP